MKHNIHAFMMSDFLWLGLLAVPIVSRWHELRATSIEADASRVHGSSENSGVPGANSSFLPLKLLLALHYVPKSSYSPFNSLSAALLMTPSRGTTYKKRTKNDLSPILLPSNSNSLTGLVPSLGTPLQQFRSNDTRVKKWRGLTVRALYTLSETS